MRTLTRAEVRELDRQAIEEFGVPGVLLMENAGRGAAEHLLALGVRGSAAICCGKGNNGGDGFVIARHLDLRGVSVRVLLFAAPTALAGDAAIMFNILQKSGLPVRCFPGPNLPTGEIEAELAGAEWIVDALLGTGLSGPPTAPYAQAIELINRAPGKVLAVDLPSGLDCDTGEPLGPTVKADHTATFVAWKRGFLAPVTYAWTGAVETIDIGAPRALVERFIPPEER